MSIWLIADTHFGHNNIIKFENRPFSNIEEMDKILINNWNNTVEKNEEIYHVGDVAICKTDRIKEILSSLSGTKYLIRGNHDISNSVTKWKNIGFDNVKTTTKKKDEFFILSYNEMEFAISHYPLENPTLPNIHGHVHSKTQHLDPVKYFCVSVECIDYKPIHIKEIVKHFKKYNNI